MPGMNLSQSAQMIEQQKIRPRASLKDKGLRVSFFLFFIAAFSYGGVFWYSQDLEKKKSALLIEVDAIKNKSYSDTDLRDVARFYVKSKEIFDNRTTPDVSPQGELRAISSQMIPEVLVTSYKNDLSDGVVLLTGTAREFRNVAEQMHIFRQSGNFSSVTTNALTINKEGLVSFSFEMTKVGSSNTKK